ncbi:thiolase family protein [Bradyrhizobium canariense]|nr:thiolase family protein [Bradyrhizobium canariense]
MLFQNRDIAIVGCARTKHIRNSGRTASDLAAAAVERLLIQTGVTRERIDGFASTLAMSDCSNPFWTNLLLENSGLCVAWCQVTDMGGASALGNIARASAAIRAGLCNIAICVASDAVSTVDRSNQVGHRTEFGDPLGYSGPLTAFGLLSTAYAGIHGGLPERALGQLAVAQRTGALLNDDACTQLRIPLTVEEYLASPFVSTPLRLLDCVMRCDGASAFLVMETSTAREIGMQNIVHPVGYREISNFDPQQSIDDITRTGFSIVGPQVLGDTGWRSSDIQSFHPYDDFLIAIILQLEQIGFCAEGRGGAFLLDRDVTFAGDFPINPGGGQISSGQPGLAGGGVNLSEALIQMYREAGDRQIKQTENAMVTGIGVIQYGRNWGVSNVMLLERGR